MPYSGSKPYGDIYQVQTSTIDNISSRLYAEHQLRQKKAQDEGKALDDMFSKNVSLIRDEDVPDLYTAYEKQKAAKIGLLANSKMRGAERINAEMAANKAAVDFWQVLNDSKQAKKGIEDITKRTQVKPDAHYDDAPTMIAQTNGVPTKILRAQGLTHPDPDRTIDPKTGQIQMNKYDPFDYNSYVDKGNVNNWMPVIQKAVGTPKDANTLSEDVKFKDSNGKETIIGQKITPIKATASPVNYYTNMAGAMAGSGKLKHFNNSFGNSYDDATAAHIVEQYQDNVKNNPLWKKAWGDEGLNISPDKLLNPATRTLALNSMAYALSNQPTLGKPQNVDNKGGVMTAKNDEFAKRTKNKQAFQILYENTVRQPNRLALLQESIAAKEHFASLNSQEQADSMENIRQDEINNGSKFNIPFFGGGEKIEINLSPAMRQSLGEKSDYGGGSVYPKDSKSYYDPKTETYYYDIDGSLRKMDKQKYITHMVNSMYPTNYKGKQGQANFKNKPQTIKGSSSNSGGASIKIKGSDKSLFD